MSTHLAPVEPFDLVIFGGTGDLAMRKLLPGLYQCDLDHQIPAESRIVAVARTELDRDGFVAEAEAAVRRSVGPERLSMEGLARFLGRLDYLALDLRGEAGWPGLAARLAEAPDRARIFYLATSPELFGPVCERLAGVGAVTPEARVVLEKPIGRDLGSARAINADVGAVFAERQVFRIDHYLGKETVQNLMALRFANPLLEPVWNRAHVDHVQITAAETVGVEGRAAYYDRSGALRDMVQNHLLQLLCLVAMEPPGALSADAVRDEKLRVLRALAPIADGRTAGRTARGQYRAGAVAGRPVPGYLEELGGANDSRAETFVAVKAEVADWRWAGVPFYLRTGKRLAARVSEIVVQFRELPHSVFGRGAGEIRPNRLVIRLQPDEGVRLLLMGKDPGPGGMRLRQVSLDLSFAEAFPGRRRPDAYERLLLDVARGDPTLFMREDEVEAAWAWIDPIVAGWAEDEDAAPHPYPAGSWGPSEAVALIARDGRSWFDAAL